MATKPLIRRPDAEALAEAGALLRQGKLVAFPTETVYGLAGDAASDRAIADLFAVKGRPRFNPLIIHVEDLAAAEALAVFDARARALARHFWPGPLTLVLPRRANAPVSLLACAGLDSLALRVPRDDVALGLIAAHGSALAAPSANRSGRLSPTQAAHVAEELGSAVSMILDGGPTALGLESTVVALLGADVQLLRPGAIERAALEALVGAPIAGAPEPKGGDLLRAPGSLASHYAPEKPLRLAVHAVAADEALLAFGPVLSGPTVKTVNLSPRADLHEAAARLFAGLRELDRTTARAIAVMPIPEAGLGEAINDRLRRAAAPRREG